MPAEDAMQERWTAVDDYFMQRLFLPDEVLEVALAGHEAAGLPPQNVTPTHERFLQLLACMQGARRILELGTLGGYSTLWLARALPDEGRLITLELQPSRAEIAERNLARAGLSERVEVRVGRAADSLERLVEQQQAPFDLIFIDADKPSYALYLTWALRLSRPGTVIVADNVVRGGRIVLPGEQDANVQGIHQFMDALAIAEAAGRLSATTIQTVGAKGYDGFVLAWVERPG